MFALKSPLPSLLTIVLGILVEVAEATAAAIFAIVEALTPPILLDEAITLELTKAAVATSVPFATSVGVGAVGLPVSVAETSVLFVKVSVPANVASVPVVGNVTFVEPVLVKVVVKLPAVIKSAVVEILPPKLIVLVPLLTPVPPNVPAIAEVNATVPSKALPYIFIGAASFVVVLALPAKLPVTLPVTLPVKLPVTSPVKLPVTLPVNAPVKLEAFTALNPVTEL